MRMVFHRVADNVGHFVVTTVVQLFGGVQNPPLHGLEAIVQMRDGTLEDYVAGVIQEIVGIHRPQGSREIVIGRHADDD